MEYQKIVAVTGIPGLFEVVTSKTDGAIVRSLDDDTTKFISSRVHNLTHLESIEIYTTGDNVSLSDILSAIKESKEPLPDVKDTKMLKSYFEKVYPELDFDRVYPSDMKKIVNWYKVMDTHKIDFTVKSEEPEEDAPEETATVVAEEPTPAKKSKAKETADDVATAKPKTRKKKAE